MKKSHSLNTEILIEVISSILKNKILEKKFSDDALRKIIFNDIKTISHRDRDNIAEDVVAKLTKILAEEKINSANLKTKSPEEKINQHVEELNRNGITQLGEFLSPQQVLEIHNYLKNKPFFNGHVWATSDKKEYDFNYARENFPQGSNRLQDIVGAPHLLEAMCDPDVIKIAEKYLGALPKLYSTNLMWSFGKEVNPKKGVARMFHRDIDNFDFCVLFIFLTDAKKGSGSHQYIKQTHKRETIQKLLASMKSRLSEKDYSDALTYLNSDKLGVGYIDNEVLPLPRIEELFKDEMLEVEGKAGYAFISDPYGLHRGVPAPNDRLLFYGRFSLFDSGFSSCSSSHKINWKDVQNRVEPSACNKYMLDSILSQDGEDDNLYNPEAKHLKENVFVGTSEEISASLLKNDGTKKFIKNSVKSIIKRKKAAARSEKAFDILK